MPPQAPHPPAFDPRAVARPHERLLTYYLILAAFTLPLFPITATAGYIRYKTLRYRLDDEGVWMAWGLLWRREINLTYRRIQDIHLTRNLLQRWMGLATVAIQTASGSASAEMSIEGILEAEPLRDYLYTQMRGARGLDTPRSSEAQLATPPAIAAPADRPADPATDEALALLTDIRDALAALAARRGEERRP